MQLGRGAGGGQKLSKLGGQKLNKFAMLLVINIAKAPSQEVGALEENDIRDFMF
jgi:hypothetical protein